jgi:hypothetical protein
MWMEFFVNLVLLSEGAASGCAWRKSRLGQRPVRFSVWGFQGCDARNPPMLGDAIPPSGLASESTK